MTIALITKLPKINWLHQHWCHECLILCVTCRGSLDIEPQIYKGDPRPCIPPLVIALSAMGLKLAVFGFLPTTYIATNAQQMCPRSSRTVLHFNTCLSSLRLQEMQVTYIHSWRTTTRLFWSREKPEYPRIWAPVLGSKWYRFWDLPFISVHWSKESIHPKGQQAHVKFTPPNILKPHVSINIIIHLRLHLMWFNMTDDY